MWRRYALVHANICVKIRRQLLGIGSPLPLEWSFGTRLFLWLWFMDLKYVLPKARMLKDWFPFCGSMRRWWNLSELWIARRFGHLGICHQRKHWEPNPFLSLSLHRCYWSTVSISTCFLLSWTTSVELKSNTAIWPRPETSEIRVKISHSLLLIVLPQIFSHPSILSQCPKAE